MQQFVEEVGVPAELVYDAASEMAGRDSSFQETARYYKIKCRQTEPATPKQNRAESTIRELKAKWKQLMVQNGVPNRLWDYGLVYCAEIMSRTSVAGQVTGIEEVTGNTPDISEWLDFNFYDWVWAWNMIANRMEENPVLGRWLGVSHRVGSDMCYWVLLENGKIVSRSTVQHVTKDDASSEAIKSKMLEFEAKIKEKLEEGASAQPVKGSRDDFYLEDIEVPGDMVEQEPDEPPEDPTPDTCDDNIGAKVKVPVGGEMKSGTVVDRVKDVEGIPIGRFNSNPTKDTRVYEVNFDDGTKEKLSANVIAESICARSLDNGDLHDLLDEITGHQVAESAIRKGTEYSDKNATLKGWSFYVVWKTGDGAWVSLKTLKDSHPLELAEYAVAHNIDDEPAFEWWVKKVLTMLDRVVMAAKARISAVGKRKRKHIPLEKFGVQIPRSVKDALALDEKNGNTLWRDAIYKEMANVRIAFKEWTEGTKEDIQKKRKLVGYQQIFCHMIFDVKMDLTRKARFVAGGHTTDPPDSLTYSSVVTRESVRIAFLMAKLHELDICAADVTNAYLNANCRENIWTEAGPEFGSEQGKIMKIKRALYGLKSSGAAWRALLASTLEEMGFKSSLADPDVWTRAATKPAGLQYYEMVLVYVDDILVVSHDTKSIMDELAKVYRLKPESVGPPTRYLGATISKHPLPDNGEAWAMSAEEYLENAIAIIKARCEKDKEKPFNKTARKRPYPCNYKPELDVSEELEGEMVTWYQQLIGMLRWVTELGRIDVLFEVTKLSSHNALPRRGHLRAVYNVFFYLHGTKSRKIVFDDLRVDTDVACFVNTDWSDFYPDADNKVPPNMLKPKGIPVKITCFVDADHAGDLVSRRSHTGIIIFVNNAPMVWFSKKQTTVEVSTFGSEFVAMRIAVEKCEALRYKLHMFGIDIAGKIDILCDNMSVVRNASIPESVLSKKHTSICYHRVREAVAAGILWIAKIDSKFNLADLLTKLLPNDLRGYLIGSIHYD
ncbi:MAG TPA: reverse transcriptase domain-containing protein [Fusibacter sp.]|nr:reverse transcriptase domain-containing protein [Fusibacter sp.]